MVASLRSHRTALRLRGVPYLRTALAFGGAVFRRCGRPLGVFHNSVWSFRIARKLACGSPYLIGLTPRCFAHRARASCAPRASSRFAAFDCALCFAPCARHSSPSGLRRSQSALATLPVSLESSYRPALRWPGIPGLRSASRCSSIQHGRPTPSHRPALTLARCSAPADFASLRVLGTPAASRPPTLASSLAALPASLGLLRPVSRTARGLRAPLASPPLRGFDDYGLFRALRAAFVRPLCTREALG